MGSTAVDLFRIMLYLLPGAITTTIIYSFVVLEKPTNFRYVMYTLMWSMLVYGLAETCGFGSENILKSQDVDYKALMLVYLPTAVLLGILWSACLTWDLFHRVFRKAKVTVENVYVSEWYSAFVNNTVDSVWILLYLEDEKCPLYGWAHEWPVNKRQGCFVIEEGQWLDPETHEIVEVARGRLLIPASSVRRVAFVPSDP